MRIVIASLLKPVDDTRMFEKLGQSLSEEAELHIIGYPSRIIPNHPSIVFHSLSPFNRLSPGRLMAPWRILGLVLKTKPDTFIITTHELLWIGVLSKILLSCKLIYDIQENYGRNLFHTPAFPKITRPFIAAYVRLKEWLTAPFVNHFLLAERGYEKELRFPGKRKTIIENKTKKVEAITKKKNDGPINLLFSGTLAETTGVFTAIDLAQQLHALDHAIQLTIIGYCSLPATLEKIRNTIHTKNFIQLIGGNQLIPHSEIILQIQSSHFGIIAYEINPSTINSIPTKLYEYLGNQLPILMIHHQPWIEMTERYPAAISFNMLNLKPRELLSKMKTLSFYDTLPTDVFWDSEVEKLKKIIEP